MSEPFLAEIRILSFDFAPRGWASCDGQLLPIAQNQALFSLLGVTYGGDGRTTFALPDFRGRVPVHVGGGFPLGGRAGAETATLGLAELPAHTHPPMAGKTAGAPSDNPIGNFWGQDPQVAGYRTASDNIAMNAAAVSNAGGPIQPHENMQPFLAMNFVIALQGLFPSRS